MQTITIMPKSKRNRGRKSVPQQGRRTQDKRTRGEEEEGGDWARMAVAAVAKKRGGRRREEGERVAARPDFNNIVRKHNQRCGAEHAFGEQHIHG